MKITADICCYCGTCVNVCPQDAIELLDSYYVELDAKICTECKICAKACPVGAIEVE